jgi:histone acetyltransferase (RNA polymerase elongator complex component)
MSILPVFVPQAGCPHQCVFCNQRTISGEQQTGLAEVKKQIQTWLPRLHAHAVNEAAFYGGSFTGLPLALQEELLEPVEELLKQGIIQSIRLSTRPDYIDAERLEFLQRHHVTLVELGVQSLDDKVLHLAGRGHTAAQVGTAVKLLRAYKFKVGLQFMVGLPGQTLASLKETAAQAVALAPDIARIYPLLVIKDTPLAEMYAKGEYTPLTLEEAVAEAAFLYETLTGAGINVIRVGLQPDEELCRPGNIIAGPFHPSMGELVQSYLKRQHVAEILRHYKFAAGDEVVIRYHARDESKVRGRHRTNVNYWQELCAPAALHLERL